jgi:hypothetical protein
MAAASLGTQLKSLEVSVDDGVAGGGVEGGQLLLPSGSGGCRRTRRERSAGHGRDLSAVAVHQRDNEDHCDDAGDPGPHRAAPAVQFKIETPELVRLARAIGQRVRMFWIRHLPSPFRNFGEH